MDLPNRENYEDETSGNLLRASMREKWQRGLVRVFASTRTHTHTHTRTRTRTHARTRTR